MTEPAMDSLSPKEVMKSTGSSHPSFPWWPHTAPPHCGSHPDAAGREHAQKGRAGGGGLEVVIEKGSIILITRLL